MIEAKPRDASIREEKAKYYAENGLIDSALKSYLEAISIYGDTEDDINRVRIYIEMDKL